MSSLTAIGAMKGHLKFFTALYSSNNCVKSVCALLCLWQVKKEIYTNYIQQGSSKEHMGEFQHTT